jgi:hypothetical protein
MSQVTSCPPCDMGGRKILGCCERVSNCQRYEVSQWTKRPVDVPFGSKCSVDVPLVHGRSVQAPSFVLVPFPVPIYLCMVQVLVLLHERVHVLLCVHIHTYFSVWVQVFVLIHISFCVFLCTNSKALVFVHIHVHMYKRTCTYTHINSHNLHMLAKVHICRGKCLKRYCNNAFPHF